MRQGLLRDVILVLLVSEGFLDLELLLRRHKNLFNDALLIDLRAT